MLPVMSLEVLVAELWLRNNISRQSRLSRTAVISHYSTYTTEKKICLGESPDISLQLLETIEAFYLSQVYAKVYPPISGPSPA